MLRIMSPGTPNKSEDPLKSLVSGGGQNYSETRKGSPNKSSNYRSKREARHRKKSEDVAKRTLDSKSGDRGHSKEYHPHQATESNLKREKLDK